MYSPSSSGSTTVWKASSGSKGNHMLEKDLLLEVAGLFLGDLSSDISRSLQKDSVSCLSSKITTELKRDKLTNEMTKTNDDETTRLFNSVSHVQQSIKAGDINDTENDDSPHGVGNTIIDDDNNTSVEDSEAVMEAMVVEEELNETADMEDDDTGSDDFNKDCLLDIWSRGWYAIDLMKVKEMRKRESDRLSRKSKMQKHILDMVTAMKADSVASVIIDTEEAPELPSPWTDMIHSLDNRYKD